MENLQNLERKHNVGSMSLDNYLPEVMKDSEFRAKAVASIHSFAERHGDIPLKYRMAQFFFDRPEQVATFDTRDKVFGWDAQDTDLSGKIINAIKPEELPVVFRSRPLDEASNSPVHFVQDYEDIRQYLAEGTGPLQENFFSRIDLHSTVIELIVNPFPQNGHFLIRPTFTRDLSLRDYIVKLGDQYAGAQYFSGDICEFDDEGLGLSLIRVIPVLNNVRETKRTQIGYLVAYDESGKSLKVIAGFPQAHKDLVIHSGSRWYSAEDHLTQLMTDEGINDTETPLLIHPDEFKSLLTPMLKWQLPRLGSLEAELRSQQWIGDYDMNVYQLLALLPITPDDDAFNTSLYDSRTHPKEDIENQPDVLRRVL